MTATSPCSELNLAEDFK